jgi:hypothetical protein
LAPGVTEATNLLLERGLDAGLMSQLTLQVVPGPLTTIARLPNQAALVTEFESASASKRGQYATRQEDRGKLTGCDYSPC